MVGTVRASDHASGFEQVGGVVAGAGLVGIGLLAAPAWTISIGLALSVFSGQFGLMGISVPIDRIVLSAGALAVIGRELRAGRRLRTRPVHWLLIVAGIYALTSGLWREPWATTRPGSSSSTGSA